MSAVECFNTRRIALDAPCQLPLVAVRANLQTMVVEGLEVQFDRRRSSGHSGRG